MDEANTVVARVIANSYLGARNILAAEVGAQQFRVETDGQVGGSQINLVMPSEALFLYSTWHSEAMQAAVPITQRIQAVKH